MRRFRQANHRLLAAAGSGLLLVGTVCADGSIFVFGENLTDQNYEYPIGYPMPGRMFQVGLDIGF